MKRDFTTNKGQTSQFKKVEAGKNMRMLILIGSLITLSLLLPNCASLSPSHDMDDKPSGKKYGDKVPLKVGYYITAEFEKHYVQKYSFIRGWGYFFLGMTSTGQFKLGLQQVFRRVETIWEEYPYTKDKAKELDLVIEPQVDKFYFHAPFFNWQIWRARITYKITLYDSKWNVLLTRSVEGTGDTKGHFWGPWSKHANIATSKAIEEGVKNAMDTILTSKEIKTLLKR